MAKFIKGLLDSLRLTEDDDLDDEYDEYIIEQEEKVRKREERLLKKQDLRSGQETKNQKASASVQQNKNNYRDEYDNPTQASSFNSQTTYNDVKKERPVRIEKTGTGKVVPIRTTAKGFEVCIMKPTSFEDSQDICDVILSGRASVINLEGFDVDLAQRVMDFVSGSIYAVNGRLHQISNYIFIISPDTVDISGDYSDLIKQDGFGVPTLNKGF